MQARRERFDRGVHAGKAKHDLPRVHIKLAVLLRDACEKWGQVSSEENLVVDGLGRRGRQRADWAGERVCAHERDAVVDAAVRGAAAGEVARVALEEQSEGLGGDPPVTCARFRGVKPDSTI